ncbi:Hypothetical predicted protein, partial [Marmota monax]
NSLLLNSAMQPDLTVSRTYSGPICLQDPLDKELMTESSLFNPLSDIKVKVQSSFMVSLGVSERAEYHGKNHSGTFPHGNNRSFSTMHHRNKTPYIQNLSSLPTRTELRTTGVFGHLGGRLVMPNTGVSLLIPHGAIPEENSWEIYMSINQGEPSLQSDGSEVLLSPEVTCGPPDIIVTTPFALTIPHCADVSSEHWNIHLKKRTQQGKWEEVMSVEDESTSCYCLLDPFACHVLLDSFGTYALTGEPITDCAVKQLKGLPPPFQAANSYSGSDIPCSVIVTTSLPFLSSPPIWEVPFSRVWCSNRQPLHCAFSLERYTPTTTQLSCKICIRQLKGHEQILQVQTSILESERETITFFAQEDSSFPAQTGPKAFKIPYSIRQRICATFDTPNAKGKDWQMLAQKNSINRNLSYFATQSSPSAVILNLWEARHQHDGDLDSLACALEEIGRTHTKLSNITESQLDEADFNYSRQNGL